MAIMFHPTQENPTRIRVYDKKFGIQKYFSIKEHGLKKATQMAEELQAEIDKKRKTHSLINELSINRIFDEQGSIKGLRRIKRERQDRATTEYLSLQARLEPGVSKHIEISLGNRKFDEAYSLLKNKIYDLYGLEKSLEMERMFKAAKRNYW